MLVWIKISLSLQEICNRIMNPNSDFQQVIIEYLETCYKRGFINGTMESMSADIHKCKEDDPCYVCPTETLPKPPPSKCQADHIDEGD